MAFLFSNLRSGSRVVQLLWVMSGFVLDVEPGSFRSVPLDNEAILATPREFVCSSGAYTLRVNQIVQPVSSPASAEYLLWSEDELLWQKTLPFVLAEVVILNDGTIIGYGYGTQHEKKGSTLGYRHYLHVVIIHRHGTEVLDVALPRSARPITSSTKPSPMRPYVEQLIVDPDHDRVILTVVEQLDIFRKQMWWIYKLSTGERIKDFEPCSLISKSRKMVRWVNKAALVPGTPLVLIHYATVNYPIDVAEKGALFGLVNSDLELIWTLELSDDYTALFNKLGRNEFRNRLRNLPAILSTTDNSFVLHCFRENKHVSFNVELDRSGNWAVSEINRSGGTPR